MKLEDKSNQISRKELLKYQFYGKICCWFTLLYNIGEGISSIVMGEEDSSISLVAFGVQSFIETASSILVLLRYAYIESKEQYLSQQPNNSDYSQHKELYKKKFLKVERIITIVIGVFFLALTIVIICVSSISLSLKNRPDSTIPNIIISGIGLVLTLFLWAVKKKVSKVTNSSAIAGDAACNLACIKLTIVMLIGSIIFAFWKGGWWIDSSIAMILSIFFLIEGYNMLKWGFSKEFNGGCSDCKPTTQKKSSCNVKDAGCSGGDASKCNNNNNGSCQDVQKQCQKNCEIIVNERDVILEKNLEY